MTDGRHAQAALPAAVQSVPLARRFALHTCREWALDGIADDVALLATELATNAYLHGGREFTVALTRHADRLRIAATDDNRMLSDGRDASAVARSTHALRIVASLASAWGTDSGEGRKTVWAEVSLP